MEKKGMGHVEVVLAFVLFIGALLFIFGFVNVRNSSVHKDSALVHVSMTLHKETEVPLTVYGIVIDSKKVPKEEQIVAIKIPRDVKSNEWVYAEDSKGNKRDIFIKSDTERNIVYVDRKDSYFVQVLVSEDLPPVGAPSSPPTLDETKSKVSSTANYNILSEKRILTLAGKYVREYAPLKEELQVSPGTEFAWSVTFGEGDFIKMNRAVPSGVDAVAINQREEILRSTGKRVFADTQVQVW